MNTVHGALTLMACAQFSRIAEQLKKDIQTAGGAGDEEVGIALITIGVSKLAPVSGVDVEKIFHEALEAWRSDDDAVERGSGTGS